MPSEQEEAWLRHYEEAARRRHTLGPSGWRPPAPWRRRRQRVILAAAVVGLCAVGALLGLVR
jgi:hypothetical protein